MQRHAGARSTKETHPMNMPMLEVTFRHMPHSRAIEAAVRERAAKLALLYPRITSCRVMVETSHHGPTRASAMHHVRVEVRVPDGELVARCEPAREHFHADVYVALRDAFNRAGREIEDYARVRRGDVKTHEEPPRGRVTKLFRDRGYGFLETLDEVEVYFHEHSVLHPGFRRLEIGTVVRYVEEEGVRGPQASTVAILEAA
jgi:cold shock CspA family protein/ribosome-associated translation inhibitor RaiA